MHCFVLYYVAFRTSHIHLDSFDVQFRIDMHARLFRGMVDTLEEVWLKQEAGQKLLPLKNTGEWQVIYANGWKYRYVGYTRSKNKSGCQIASAKKPASPSRRLLANTAVTKG